MNTDVSLMERMIEKVWLIVLTSTERVLVANAPDPVKFVDHLCEKWLATYATNILVIRVYPNSLKKSGSCIRTFTYVDYRYGLTNEQLRDVGIVILIEDELGLMSKINHVMDSVRASKMGDIPVVCVSHLPNRPEERKIAKWFNHLMDGKVMSATMVKSPLATEPVAIPSPSAPSHPYYRNFAAASSAARRLLQGQEKTRETYEAECGKDPKLPPNPAAVYRDFERKGGWAMFLTGHPSEADQ